MSASTDTFLLNKTEIFKNIRENLPKNLTNIHNFIESFEDMLFGWNVNECVLLSWNWRAAKIEEKKIKCQKLVPSNLQNFQVEKLEVSPEGSAICLSGKNGLAILELPKRWGSFGQFSNGKEIITCKTFNVDEQFFINNNNTVQILQVRWHPGSPTDSHILVLMSDNTIRLYNESNLRHVWRVGPSSGISKFGQKLINTQNESFPNLHSIGENTIDFDIAPAKIYTSNLNDSKDKTKTFETTNISITNVDSESEKVIWPIILLRGNGNVYVLNAGIEMKRPKLQGPLIVRPQNQQNYGLESCSIAVIPSLPPTVVIAESNGNIHHALFLEAESLDESINEIDDSIEVTASEWEIDVFETVKLELSLIDSGNNENMSPVQIKRDIINTSRYYAIHNAGIHAIVINNIKELQRFLDSGSELGDVILNSPSSAEYLICTKINENNSQINTVLGCTILQMPSGIVVLLGSGEVISLNLIIDQSILHSAKQLQNYDKSSASIDLHQSPIQKVMKESFINYIFNLLKRSLTQPILSVDKNAEFTAQDMYNVLVQSISTLKDQYFKKHEKVRTEILRRVKILKLLKEQQLKELEHLENEKKIINSKNEYLAQRFQEIYEKQQELSLKCQVLVKDSNIAIPNNNKSHTEFKDQVLKINDTANKLSQRLQQIKNNIEKRKFYIEKQAKTNKNKQFALPHKQENLIREILYEITGEIDLQIKVIKRINNFIDL